jgi:hypothetical protein
MAGIMRSRRIAELGVSLRQVFRAGPGANPGLFEAFVTFISLCPVINAIGFSAQLKTTVQHLKTNGGSTMTRAHGSKTTALSVMKDFGAPLAVGLLLES